MYAVDAKTILHISACFVLHRLVFASSTSNEFNAQEASRTMVAPFFILMKPNAESSTVNFLGSQSPHALPVWSLVCQLTVGRTGYACRLVVVHHPQCQVKCMSTDIDQGAAALLFFINKYAPGRNGSSANRMSLA